MGVCPMSSRTLAAIGGRLTAGASSDVVHRSRSTLALAPTLGQLAESEPVDHARHRLGDLVPQLHQILSISPGSALDARLERAAGALDGTKDGADRDRFRRTGQMVTPGGPAFRGEQPRALQRQQHLLQVALGNDLARGDLLDGDETTSVVQGQVEHRLDRVLALGRDPHPAGGRHTSRPSASRRAASRAKYVITMSAPARRMPVSASIIARRSSNQPSWPAALIMAYSPETEYAASGTPNSLLAREMTSRYGRAGLTMTMSAPSSRSSAISRMASVAFAGSI